ncbi:MAG: hypothetical protein AUG51_20055 [Acidobacteria bacterium 13_1_20CM_3_53_8]|nr:MAG: hypothetical protein AUG51_20055 [Acidobacteria bacterium 13_1_20CM_3_53_8]
MKSKDKNDAGKRDAETRGHGDAAKKIKVVCFYRRVPASPPRRVSFPASFLFETALDPRAYLL